jgi:tRNA (cmo5U34)-methyltransferase
MIDQSKFKDRIFYDDQLPVGPWDVILANWTLHFIKNQYEYLEKIYNELVPGGLFILTNKMEHNTNTEDLYHDFKRLNGVTEEEIIEKKQSLVGVLNTKPLDWYFERMAQIGFINIELINSNLMFHTIVARK